MNRPVIVDDTLYRGFEVGVIDWDVIPVMQVFAASPTVTFEGYQWATGGVWLWLNQIRFFLAYPSRTPPPKDSEFVGMRVVGVVVELRFRKRRRDYLWVGDALRFTPTTPETHTPPS